MKEATKARLHALQATGGKWLAGGSALMLAASANAAAMDVTGVTTAISDQTTNIQTIAVAVLGVLALIAGVAYLRRVIH